MYECAVKGFFITRVRKDRNGIMRLITSQLDGRFDLLSLLLVLLYVQYICIMAIEGDHKINRYEYIDICMDIIYENIYG